MPSTLRRLVKLGLATPPSHVPEGVQYEVIMGSYAYGVSSDTSDIDIYGFSIPDKDVVFPHLAGHILGFGAQPKKFEQYQQHHIQDQSTGKEYDLNVYNIVKYFQLCMENNPNMLDSLFVPQRCVLYITPIGNLVRENRKLFLHKGAWHRYKGYSYSQLHKMSGGKRTGKRKELYDRHQFDVKYAYHLVRLLYEVQMILEEGDLDLERNREHLKAIRRGEIPEADIRQWASDKEKHLEKSYETSKLPYGPDEPALRALLLQCLEQYYGSLQDALAPQDLYKNAVQEITAIVDRMRKYS